MDWEKKFSNSKMKIVVVDQIIKQYRFQPKEMKYLLNLEKLRKILNSTETLYFMESR